MGSPLPSLLLPSSLSRGSGSGRPQSVDLTSRSGGSSGGDGTSAVRRRIRLDRSRMLALQVATGEPVHSSAARAGGEYFSALFRDVGPSFSSLQQPSTSVPSSSLVVRNSNPISGAFAVGASDLLVLLAYEGGLSGAAFGVTRECRRGALVRWRAAGERSAEEKAWVAIDHRMHPALYAHAPGDDATAYRTDPAYSCAFPVEELHRLAALPLCPAAALPWLRSREEVRAHALLATYLHGHGEAEERLRDHESGARAVAIAAVARGYVARTTPPAARTPEEADWVSLDRILRPQLYVRPSPAMTGGVSGAATPPLRGPAGQSEGGSRDPVRVNGGVDGSAAFSFSLTPLLPHAVARGKGEAVPPSILVKESTPISAATSSFIIIPPMGQAEVSVGAGDTSGGRGGFLRRTLGSLLQLGRHNACQSAADLAGAKQRSADKRWRRAQSREGDFSNAVIFIHFRSTCRPITGDSPCPTHQHFE